MNFISSGDIFLSFNSTGFIDNHDQLCVQFFNGPISIQVKFENKSQKEITFYLNS